MTAPIEDAEELSIPRNCHSPRLSPDETIDGLAFVPLPFKNTTREPAASLEKRVWNMLLLGAAVPSDDKIIPDPDPMTGVVVPMRSCPAALTPNGVASGLVASSM